MRGRLHGDGPVDHLGTRGLPPLAHENADDCVSADVATAEANFTFRRAGSQ